MSHIEYMYHISSTYTTCWVYMSHINDMYYILGTYITPRTDVTYWIHIFYFNIEKRCDHRKGMTVRWQTTEPLGLTWPRTHFLNECAENGVLYILLFKDVSDNLDCFHKLGFHFESLLSCKVEGLGKPGLSHCWGRPCHSLVCWQYIWCLAWRRSKPARFQVMASIPELHNFRYFEGIRNSHFSLKCSVMK